MARGWWWGGRIDQFWARGKGGRKKVKREKKICLPRLVLRRVSGATPTLKDEASNSVTVKHVPENADGKER